MNILKTLGFFCALLMLNIPASVWAQENDLGNWLMYFGTNTMSDKFSIHTELQYRNHDLIPGNIEQLLLRTGLNYHFTESAFVTVGYAYVSNYIAESKQSSPEIEEHRIWQQFILVNHINRIKFEHRYRVEQRWIGDKYRNRFRYRLMLFVPLNNEKIETGTVFIGLYGELFINSTNSYFDRSRLYGALGYQINKSTGIQVGMLHQQTSDVGKWNFQLTLVYNPDFRRSKNN